MDSKLTIQEKSEELPVLVSREQLAQQTAAFFARGIEGADNTRKVYQSDIARGLPELPIDAATLAAYISDLAATRKWSMIARRLAAIRQWHRLHNYANPASDEAVKTVIEGIKLSIGTEPEQSPAFDIEEYKACLAQIPAARAFASALQSSADGKATTAAGRGAHIGQDSPLPRPGTCTRPT